MIKDKKIAIYGFAKEGLSAANYLGLQNEIHIYDRASREKLTPFLKKLKVKKVKFFLQGTKPKNTIYDFVVKAPGVKHDDLLLKSLINKGTILTSGTKIFFDQCPAEIIGVTGTKGKGTTSTLIFEMLKKKYKGVYLAGNIGTPALDILPKLSAKSVIVLELSSFQLMDLKKSPRIAVVLMTTSEHLDWHKDNQEYVDAKVNIVRYQKPSDIAIVNDDFKNSKKIAEHTRSKVLFFSTNHNTNGVYINSNKIISEINSYEEIAKTSDVFIPGRHNLQNVSAAAAVAITKGIPRKKIQEVLRSFKGLKHRLQFVKKVKGVSYYNDSFSTTPETAIAALAAFTIEKTIILGGSSKDSDFTNLAKSIVNDKFLKTVILIGKESKKIEKAITIAGPFKGKILKGAKNMKEIVGQAQANSNKGSVVILSPACASFDMFKNYEDRGEQFEREVIKLSR